MKFINIIIFLALILPAFCCDMDQVEEQQAIKKTLYNTLKNILATEDELDEAFTSSHSRYRFMKAYQDKQIEIAENIANCLPSDITGSIVEAVEKEIGNPFSDKFKQTILRIYSETD
jgi:hypothetical protein